MAIPDDIKAKLTGLIDYILNTYDAIWGKQAKKQNAINLLSVNASKEFIQTAYKSLPPEVQQDPDVKSVYSTKIASAPDYTNSILAPVQKAAEDIAKWMTDTYMNITPATPDTAKTVAMALVAADATKDVAIGMLGLSAEVLSAGQVDTTTDFFKFMRAKTGYGGPMTMIMKSPIELGVISPLSKALHSQYRDKWLSSQEALILSTKGHLDEDHMQKAFQYEGYPDWAIKATVADRYRELRVGELAWAMTDSMTDDKWIDEKLKAALYSPEDRPLITRMLRERYLRPYRDQVAGMLTSLYKEGYITYAQFSDRLKQLGIPEQVRNMMASKAQYQYTMDYNTDLISTWVTAYKNDIINEDILRGNLSTILADPARVAGLVNKAKAARKPVSVAVPKPVEQGIHVSSKPSNSVIILDGRDSGKLTPETLTTSIGTHTVLVSADGYHDYEFNVNVGAGEFVEVYAVLDEVMVAA
jgi:hypothetical protein